MTRRPGLSLTEVLVALFIMALGTIAILTLFPLGAIRMGQALKDDRTAQAANQADSYMRWYWQNFVIESGPDAFTTAFTNPGNGQTVAGSGSPSYPVFVDPIGNVAPWTGGSGGTASAVAGLLSLPRQTLNLVNGNPSLAFRTCSLMDGFGYAPGSGGTPIDPVTGLVDRDFRYNWLWVLQRPNSQYASEATMTVVVFDRRAYLYSPPNAEYAAAGVALTPGQTSITAVSVPAGVNVQKGGWVMDASGSVGGSPPPQAYFYRIVSATQNGAAVDLELQTPLRRIDGSTAAYTGTLVFLAGIADVFERPSLAGPQF